MGITKQKIIEKALDTLSKKDWEDAAAASKKKKIAKSSESETQHEVRRHTRRNTYGMPDKSKRRRIINQKGAFGRPQSRKNTKNENHVFEKVSDRRKREREAREHEAHAKTL